MDTIDEKVTVTIVVPGTDGTPVTWRTVTTDADGVVVEDLTYTIAPELVSRFVRELLPLGFGVYQRGVEVDNLAVEAAELAAVEASFPTGAQVDAEDELRERLTAEGIAHGNF